MEKIIEFLKSVIHIQYINSILIIVISFIIYKCIARFLKEKESNVHSKIFKSKRGKTYLRLIKSMIRYIFIIVTALIVLQVNGVNVSSMLAGVGILSVIIGFAVQDGLKDIIKGIDIISENYYQVGDIIKYGNIEGKVLVVGIKTTKVEDIRSFNIISISNRNIEQVEIVSNVINIDVPLPYELKLEKAEKVILEIVELVKGLENVEKCEYRGVNDFADSSIKYQIRSYCSPSLKVQTRRDILGCILMGLEKNNIQIPYNQIDVHQKK